MDEFERYLADLGRQNPHLSTLVEAVPDGYKICHPDEPDGIVKPHCASVGASSAILAKSAYLDRCYASESSSSCVMEAISNPHNLPNQKENSKKVRPGQVEEAKFIDGRILSRRIDTILNKSSLLQMVSSSNGSYTEIIGNVLGMSTGASRYKLFYPNADKTDKREIRVSYHNVVLTNIPVNVGKAFCITFVRPDKEHLFQQENLLHNTIRHRNIDDTECLEYILYHSKLKSDVQCHTDDITQSLLYQVLKGVQENLTTGDVSQFPVSQQTPHNGESQNTDSPTTNNGKDKPLTDAVNQQPLTNLGESVMNTYQKSYTAFMESVCNKFNCPDALPALKEGFQAFCEASDYGTTRYVRGYHQGQDGKFYVGDTIVCMRGPKEVMGTIREYANQHYEPGFKLNVVDGIYGKEVSITGYPKVVYDAPDSQMPYDKFQILTKHQDVTPLNKAGRGVPAGVNQIMANPKGYYNLTPTDRHYIRAGRLMDDINGTLGEDDTPIKSDEELADWLRSND